MQNKKFSSILKAINRGNKPLNILTAPTHEAYETQLSKTGHNFFAAQHQNFKKWNFDFRPVPHNYCLLNGDNIEAQIKPDMVFDLVLSQNKFGQFQLLSQMAKHFGCPLISLEHTLPLPKWNEKERSMLKSMRGDLNVFISDYSINEWGFDKNDLSVEVIHHGIDTKFFSGWVGGNGRVLSVVNDFINRDWCCGFKLWQQITEGLQVLPVGSTPGLSRPAKDEQELRQFYRSCSIFVNTSLISPIPTALLEAASVGCPIVSTATCMIPKFFKNGVHGIISNNPEELKNGLHGLLSNEKVAIEMGQEAQKMVRENFDERNFINGWNNLFNKAMKTNTLGWVQ